MKQFFWILFFSVTCVRQLISTHRFTSCATNTSNTEVPLLIIMADEELNPDFIAHDGEIEEVDPSHVKEILAYHNGIILAEEQQRKFAANKQILDNWLHQTAALVTHLSRSSEKHKVYSVDGLNVLDLEIKLGARSSIVEDVGPVNVKVLQGKLELVNQRLQKLITRINDTASRVLVTGDLNSGKSSLCNALLRRRILPVDQQPCTEIFCEVVDWSSNNYIEEVHAVKSDREYDIADQSSYDFYSVTQLDDLVKERNKYKLLVIYIRDMRPPEKSLLANGSADIRLIDAPGLNVSSVTTTQLFGRQEEIDLVIFAVSAENHFTQSAMEFVDDTAQEKSLLFFAVNMFDKINDKERCRKRILDQIQDLAPETRKMADDLVHFVSSTAGFEDSASSDPQDPNSDGPEDPEDPENPDENPYVRDIDNLDAKVRSFVLEKRSATKLAPARTYLVNVLHDLKAISHASSVKAAEDSATILSRLQEITPELDHLSRNLNTVYKQTENDCEQLLQTIQRDSEKDISRAVAGETTTMPPWKGVTDVFGYSDLVKSAILENVLQTVKNCEDKARSSVVQSVHNIYTIGITQVGPESVFQKVFVPNAMFTRRRDLAAHNVDVELSVVDLVRLPTYPISLPWKSDTNALVRATSGFTLFSLYQYMSYMSYIPRISEMSRVVPTKTVVVSAVAIAVAACAAFVLEELPKSVPQTLSTKIKHKLESEGYARRNADRITKECRTVLAMPLTDLKGAFSVVVNDRTREKLELERESRQLIEATTLFDSVDQNANDLILEANMMVLGS